MADRERVSVSRRPSRYRGPLKKNSNMVNAINSQSGGRKSGITLENRSENSDIAKQKHLTVQLENTYRMMPPQEERFEVAKMEQLMSEILEERLKETEYNSATCSELSKELACTIITRSKEFKWRRYKLVAQVHLGQKDSQALRVASRCIWDAHTDTYACVSYNNKSLFAVASCYGIYFE